MLKRSIKSHIASDGGMRFFCVYTHINKNSRQTYSLPAVIF